MRRIRVVVGLTVAVTAALTVGMAASGCCCPCSYVGGVDVDAGVRRELKPDLLPERPRAKSPPLR